MVSAALICGILSSLLEEGTAKMLVRMVSGIFLTVTALSPLTKLDLDTLGDITSGYRAEGTALAVQGEKMAREAAGAIIKQRLEAYILDKAAALEASVDAQVQMAEDNTPAAVTIRGNISPYARSRLETALETELGIPKERQIWTG